MDIQHKLIYVKSVDGKMEVSWPGDFGEVHTRIVQRMKQVLMEDTLYPYLKPNAQKRLETARHVARNTGIRDHSLIHLGGYSWCLFPWLGTRSFRAMRKILAKNAAAFGISGIEYEGCYFINFKMSRGNDYELINALSEQIRNGAILPESLVGVGEAPVFEKYDDYVPAELLRRAYASDTLNGAEAERRILEIEAEF